MLLIPQLNISIKHNLLRAKKLACGTSLIKLLKPQNLKIKKTEKQIFNNSSLCALEVRKMLPTINGSSYG
jgi:hypothetical protein